MLKAIHPIPLFLLACLCFPSTASAQGRTVYESKTLKIQSLSKGTYMHISYLQTESFGRVACNGLIVVDDGEAIIMDTPVNDSVSVELLNWIEHISHIKPIAIVVTHFHDDCLGGLSAFHSKGIPSYANKATITLAAKANKVLPQNGFDKQMELPVGNHAIVAAFPGEGHTHDNIVCYYPQDKVLFGGCLIKENGAGKGNLEDANVAVWPATVEKVISLFPDVEIVVPGHGEAGDKSLLTYTIALFSKN